MNATSGQIEHILLRVIVQLVVILAAARFFGVVFRKLGQPQVCGEIAGGLILGPSLFGRLFPGLFHQLFEPSVGVIFTMLSQIGLILLLFVIGLEFEFSHLRNHGHKALSISLLGMLAPFILGLGVAKLLYPHVGQGMNRLGFALFVATALSITALPIMGRILIEFNLNRTRLGVISITAAAIDDAAGWVILAVVAAIVASNFELTRTVLMVLEVIGYAAFMLLVARPLLIRWTRRVVQREGQELSITSLAILLVLIFLSAAATNVIGIFSIFGGFIIGAILYDQHEFREAVMRRLRDFVTVFFLPIFFTYTGLRTDMGSMHGGVLWALCGLVLAASIMGKLGACTVAARLNGFSLRDAWSIGTLMNTRALMGLVVANIGYDLGVVPKSVFFMLVLMCVITTFMTAPLFSRLIAYGEMKALFANSEFMLQGRKAPRPATIEELSSATRSIAVSED